MKMRSMFSAFVLLISGTTYGVDCGDQISGRGEIELRVDNSHCREESLSEQLKDLFVKQTEGQALLQLIVSKRGAKFDRECAKAGGVPTTSKGTIDKLGFRWNTKIYFGTESYSCTVTSRATVMRYCDCSGQK